MKKFFCVTLALILCITCLCSCGKKDTSGKSFAAAVSSLPKTFDPQIASDDVEKTIALNCFDTLFRPDENGEMQCLAAESYSVSADELVYTIKLRVGLKYFVPSSAKSFIEKNGGTVPTDITASDFVFGITRGILPETKAADYSLLSNIKNAEAVHKGEADKSSLGIKAEGDTLIITLEKPDGNFLFALSQAVCAPCNEQFFNLTAGRYGLEIKYTVFSGGFYVSGISEDYVTISKNSEYTGENAAVPGSVTFYLNEDFSQVASKIKKENIDCAFLDGESKKAAGDKITEKGLSNITYSLVFNFSQERFDSLNLRKGLVSAIDFSVFSENRADGIVAPDYLLAGNKISNSSVNQAKTDIENARKMLTDALAELETSTLDIRILCTKDTEYIAKGIVNSWQKNIGVELNGTVSALEQKDFESAIRGKDFDLVIYPLSSSSSDAKSVLSVFKSGNNMNFSGYKSEEYDRIFNDLTENPTSEKLSYAQSFLIENAIVTPLQFSSKYFVCAENVNGIYFVYDASNIYFGKGRKE